MKIAFKEILVSRGKEMEQPIFSKTEEDMYGRPKKIGGLEKVSLGMVCLFVLELDSEEFKSIKGKDRLKRAEFADKIYFSEKNNEPLEVDDEDRVLLQGLIQKKQHIKVCLAAHSLLKA